MPRKGRRPTSSAKRREEKPPIPEGFTEEEWLREQEHENLAQFLSPILSTALEEAVDAITDIEITRRCQSHVVSEMLMYTEGLLEATFLRRDAGELPFEDDDTWHIGDEPMMTLIDTWAAGCVPLDSNDANRSESDETGGPQHIMAEERASLDIAGSERGRKMQRKSSAELVFRQSNALPATTSSQGLPTEDGVGSERAKGDISTATIGSESDTLVINAPSSAKCPEEAKRSATLSESHDEHERLMEDDGVTASSSLNHNTAEAATGDSSQGSLAMNQRSKSSQSGSREGSVCQEQRVLSAPIARVHSLPRPPGSRRGKEAPHTKKRFSGNTNTVLPEIRS